MATPASKVGEKEVSAVEVLANFNPETGKITKPDGTEHEIRSIKSWNAKTKAVIGELNKKGATPKQLKDDTETLEKTTFKVIEYFEKKQVQVAQKEIIKITEATASTQENKKEPVKPEASAPVSPLPEKPGTVVAVVAAPVITQTEAKPETVVAVVAAPVITQTEKPETVVVPVKTEAAAPAPVSSLPEAKPETVVAVAANPEGTLNFFSKAWSVVTPGRLFGSLLASAALVKTAATTLCAPVAGWLGTQAQGPVCAVVSSVGNGLSIEMMRQAAPYLQQAVPYVLLGGAIGVAVNIGLGLGATASTVSAGERPAIVTSTDASAEKPIAEAPAPTPAANLVETPVAAEKPVETVVAPATPAALSELPEVAANSVKTPDTKTTGSLRYMNPAKIREKLQKLTRRAASADSRAPVRDTKTESKKLV